MATNGPTSPDYAEFDYGNFLAELSVVKDKSVVPTLNWYRKHAERAMILFRLTGVLLILLSLSVPMLATLQGIWSERLLPMVALAIAGLTGLNSFFQWDSAWRSYRQAQFAIEHYLANWELVVAEAKHLADTDEAMKCAMQATQKLLDDVRSTTASETGKYFEQVQLPQSGKD